MDRQTEGVQEGAYRQAGVRGTFLPGDWGGCRGRLTAPGTDVIAVKAVVFTSCSSVSGWAVMTGWSFPLFPPGCNFTSTCGHFLLLHNSLWFLICLPLEEGCQTPFFLIHNLVIIYRTHKNWWMDSHETQDKKLLTLWYRKGRIQDLFSLSSTFWDFFFVLLLC